MKIFGSIRSIALLAAVAGLAMAAPEPAAAQGFFNMLFGGSGGGKHETHFVSRERPGSIVVSFGDRRLYYILPGNRAISYPIAIPREQSRWSGVTNVSQKRVNPGWTPTAEMRRENPALPAYVPGGHPMNPLGVRALYLGSSLYRIHGTDAPWTIGTSVSKGCIRMYNEDAIDLYNRTRIGAKVVVTWKRFAAGQW
jgi:lipoprotein-anchoring transpeptidase ErfK/SrfK